MIRCRPMIVALIATVVVGTGCTTLGPDFQTPQSPQVEAWQDIQDQRLQADQSVQAQWWKIFNDPILDSLVDEAYRQNIPLRVAGLRILQSRAVLGIAVGDQYPQRQRALGSATSNRISENSPNFSPTVDETFANYEAGFDAAWEIDFWGRFRRNIESADASLSASIADYHNALVSLTAEVASAYVAIRTFEERIILANQNVKLQQRSLKIADVRFRNGATTELDVQQALSNLKNTEALIPELEQFLRQARNALSVLLGLPPSELKDRLGTQPGQIPTTPVSVAVGVPAELLRRRPDVRSAELQAAAQSAQIGIAQADLYPSFSLAGSIGVQTSDTGRSDLGDLFDHDSLFGSIGPGFQWNILNYGRFKNNVRVQDAAFQTLVETYRNTVLNAYQEVEDAMVGFIQTQEQVVFRDASAKAAARSAQLANIQYRDGAVDFQRVVDAERTLVNQQDQLTDNRGNVVQNLIAIYKALGGGWEISADQEFVPETIRNEMAERTDWGNILEREASEPEQRNKLSW